MDEKKLQPKPSEIESFKRWATPFVGCFKRFECELAAAIYAEACRIHGDSWQSIGFAQLGDALIALSSEPKPPSWLSFMSAFGKEPDFHGLVDGGWLVRGGDDETPTMMVTDEFFVAVERYTRFVCSPERPKPDSAIGSWAHKGAVDVEEPDGSVRMKCLGCGATWKAEPSCKHSMKPGAPGLNGTIVDGEGSTCALCGFHEQ